MFIKRLITMNGKYFIKCLTETIKATIKTNIFQSLVWPSHCSNHFKYITNSSHPSASPIKYILLLFYTCISVPIIPVA